MRWLPGLVLTLSIFAGVGSALYQALIKDAPDKYATVALPARSATVKLPEGSVGVWYRERRKLQHSGSRGSGNLGVPPLAYSLHRVGSSRRVTLKAPDGINNFGKLHDLNFKQVNTIRIPRDGSYVLTVTTAAVAGLKDPAITFGNAPTVDSWLGYFKTAGIIIGGGVLAFIVLNLLVGRRRRVSY